MNSFPVSKSENFSAPISGPHAVNGPSAPKDLTLVAYLDELDALVLRYLTRCEKNLTDPYNVMDAKGDLNLILDKFNIMKGTFESHGIINVSLMDEGKDSTDLIKDSVSAKAEAESELHRIAHNANAAIRALVSKTQK